MTREVELALEQGYTFETLCENALITVYAPLIDQLQQWRQFLWPDLDHADYERAKLNLAVFLIITIYSKEGYDVNDLFANCRNQDKDHLQLLISPFAGRILDKMELWLRRQNWNRLALPDLCCLLKINFDATYTDGVGNLLWQCGVPTIFEQSPQPGPCLACRNVLEQAYRARHPRNIVEVHDNTLHTITSAPLGLFSDTATPLDRMYFMSMPKSDREKFSVIHPDAPIRWVLHLVPSTGAGGTFYVEIQTAKKVNWKVPPGYAKQSDACFRAREYYQRLYDRLNLLGHDEKVIKQRLAAMVPYFIPAQDQLSYMWQQPTTLTPNSAEHLQVRDVDGRLKQISPGYQENGDMRHMAWAQSVYQRRMYYDRQNLESSVPFNYDFNFPHMDPDLMRPYLGRPNNLHTANVYGIDVYDLMNRNNQTNVNDTLIELWNWPRSQHHVRVFGDFRRRANFSQLTVWYPYSIDETTRSWYQREFNRVFKRTKSEAQAALQASRWLIFFDASDPLVKMGRARPIPQRQEVRPFLDLWYAVNLIDGITLHLTYPTIGEAISTYERITEVADNDRTKYEQIIENIVSEEDGAGYQDFSDPDLGDPDLSDPDLSDPDAGESDTDFGDPDGGGLDADIHDGP